MADNKIIIPEECIKFLEENIPDYQKYTEINDLLEVIEDLQLEKGFTDDWQEVNDFGVMAERVYDKIFYAN